MRLPHRWITTVTPLSGICCSRSNIPKCRAIKPNAATRAAWRPEGSYNSTILGAGRLETPATPVSSSALAASPPQPS